jgi:hypothetical protein
MIAMSTAILQITQYKGISRQTANALRSIAFVLEQMDEDSKGDRIADRVKAQLEGESSMLAAKIRDAETAISNTRAEMEAAARTARKVTEDAMAAVLSIQAATTTVTATASQLSETTTTYRDAVAKAAALPQNTPTAITAAPTLNARVRAREGVKQRQILVDAANAGTQILAEMDNAGLAKRANEILSTIGTEHMHTVVSARRLANGGILFELDSEEAATWINEAQHRIRFTEALAPEARIKTRLFPLVIQFIPLHFGPDKDNELRYIENINRLAHGAIDRAKWLKPTHRRSPTQTCGHALITFTNPEVANKVLTNGMIVCQKRVYAEKCKKEPTRCLKCQGWNHMSYACPQTYDTCGTCGNRHRTSACTNSNRLHCISCSTDTHASWDRSCPSFTRRCDEMDDRLPENLMPYYPTAEPWTHVSQPPRTPAPTLILPRSSAPPGAEGWKTVSHRKGTHKQTTLTFQPPAQERTAADQGPPLTQQQLSPATMPNRIEIGPATRWGDADANTGQPLPSHA